MLVACRYMAICAFRNYRDYFASDIYTSALKKKGDKGDLQSWHFLVLEFPSTIVVFVAISWISYVGAPTPRWRSWRAVSFSLNSLCLHHRCYFWRIVRDVDNADAVPLPALFLSGVILLSRREKDNLRALMWISLLVTVGAIMCIVATVLYEANILEGNTGGIVWIMLMVAGTYLMYGIQRLASHSAPTGPS